MTPFHAHGWVQELCVMMLLLCHVALILAFAWLDHERRYWNRIFAALPNRRLQRRGWPLCLLGEVIAFRRTCPNITALLEFLALYALAFALGWIVAGAL